MNDKHDEPKVAKALEKQVGRIRSGHDVSMVLEEARRRAAARSGFMSSAFAQQRKFMEDPCRLKAALCTRRAGKSYSMGLLIYKEAMQNPGCSILYLGLSYQAAKRIILKDIFMEISKRFSIPLQVNHSDLSLRFPNGSMVYINGADANEKAHSKLLGQKYKLVVIDEAAEWKTDLIGLVYNTLKPAMVDNDGTICMVGVPGNVHGFFYDVTTQARDPHSKKVIFPGWSIHKWTAHDNPHVGKRWKDEIDKILKEDPHFVESPVYKQQYLGQWVMDPDATCYRYDDDRNRVPELPQPKDRYEFVLGVDLGWNDPTAFVLGAYLKDGSESRMYVVHASKQSKMLPDDIATRVHELEKEYEIGRYIIDGANKQLMQDLIQRLGIPFEPATKGTTVTKKRDYIHMASADLLQRKVVVAGDECEDLVDEWKKLVWDKTDRYNPHEHRACENHCADAFLYAWMECYAFNQKLRAAVEDKPHRDGPAWAVSWEKELAKRSSREQDDLSALDDLLR